MLSPQACCPLHISAPLIVYNGQSWCRFCAANKYSFVETYRRWLYFCQWGMVLATPLLMIAIAAIVPIESHLSQGRQSRVFWWFLLVPTTYVSASLAIAVGHSLIRLWHKYTRNPIDLVPWFHPTHALRDWALIAIGCSPLYGFILIRGQGLAFLGRPAEVTRDWMLYRAPLLFLSAFVVLFLLDRWRLVTRDAILPPVGANKKLFYIVGYAFLMAVFYLYVQNALANLAMQRIGPDLFFAALTILLVSLLTYGVLNLLFKSQIAKVGTARQGAVPATIALVGPSNAGKTIFLSRAYSLLQTVRGGMVNLDPTPESKQFITPILEELETKRVWPPGTVHVHDVPFSLYYGLEEMIRFKWLDLPGGVFINPNDPRYQSQAAHFEQHLINADAVAMILDAEDVAQALGQHPGQDMIRHEQIYHDVAKKLYTRLKGVGTGARPVPLAVIVTKSCRVSKLTQFRIRQRLRSFETFWEKLAEQSGLPKPPIRIFLSSAVVTKSEDLHNVLPPKTTPLVSEQCVEPVAWLAAQVMRSHMGVMDMKFSGHSELQESICRMEGLSSR